MLRREEPMIKVHLGVRRKLQIKMFLMHLRPTMRGVVVLKLINLFSRIVGSNMLGSV